MNKKIETLTDRRKAIKKRIASIDGLIDSLEQNNHPKCTVASDYDCPGVNLFCKEYGNFIEKIKNKSVKSIKDLEYLIVYQFCASLDFVPNKFSTQAESNRSTKRVNTPNKFKIINSINTEHRLFKKQNYALALKYFKDLDKNDITYDDFLSLVEFKIDYINENYKKIISGINTLEASEKSIPLNNSFYILRGLSYAKLQNYQRAKRDNELAYRYRWDDEDGVIPQWNLAIIALKEKKYNECIKILNKIKFPFSNWDYVNEFKIKINKKLNNN